jgi:cysteine synthase A
MVKSSLRVLRAARAAAKPLARGYATSVTGMGREVEGFVGAVGHTPLVRHQLNGLSGQKN